MNEFLELKNIQGISENEIQPYFRVGNLLQKKRVLNIKHAFFKDRSCALVHVLFKIDALLFSIGFCPRKLHFMNCITGLIC